MIFRLPTIIGRITASTDLAVPDRLEGSGAFDPVRIDDGHTS